jgi:putative ABC transport system permease protein
MTALHRKLMRDLWGMKTQAIAIALVIGAGVATFVMSLATLYTMEGMRDRFYERHRFSHAFTHLKRAPNSLAKRLAAIPGVTAADARIVVDVTLDLAGVAEPASARIVSLPETHAPALNMLYLRRGRIPEAGHRHEVVANEAFAEAHGLRLGDSINAILNGKLEQLLIVGIALSPEFIYAIRPGEIWPDNKRFAVLWMNYPALATAFDLDGAFNDVALALAHGASEPEILRQLDTLTAPYGGTGAYDRADQVSHRFVSDELTQLRAMAMIPPAIFLSVAAFLLNVVITRLVSTQREQIAMLKAFGYTGREVGMHYLQFTLLIVGAGVGIGIISGARLGFHMTNLYVKFFRFPAAEFELAPSVLLAAALISLSAGVLGVLAATRRAIQLPPAEAMQPEPPPHYRPTLVERIGLQRFFSQMTRMILRQLERHPLKAAFTVLGIALAIAVMVLGSFSRDLVDYVNDFQFFRSQRYDLSVAFVEPASAHALHEIAHLPGVQRAEPFRSVAIRLRHEHRQRRLSILGLRSDGELLRLLNIDATPVSLPPEGVVISEKLAQLLGAKVGDRITVEVLEGERPVREAAVTGVIRDFSGLSAYMNLGALNRLLREGDVLSGAFLAVDPRAQDGLYRHLKQTPRVAAVNSKRLALESFREIMRENLLRMRLFNVVFASIIAFGVVYNSSRITLAERSRELATLRVIGFTRGEISAVLLGEIALLTLAAIPPGIGLGYVLGSVATAALETETQRFPFVIYPATYAFAVVTVLIAAIISGLIVRERIDKLDLVAVLKARE